MELALPAEVERKVSPQEAALGLAIGLFVSERLTLGQAAKTAGLPQGVFMKELAARKIPLHYGPEELKQDLATLGK
jgi:predicted HTH domain antitoxin